MAAPPTDIDSVLAAEVKEWHFHIYFHQNNARERAAALALRDAVLRLRAAGAFVAVPLFRVNMGPIGPHPAGACGRARVTRGGGLRGVRRLV
jgi:DOPA 4,5-dioxygenase